MVEIRGNALRIEDFLKCRPGSLVFNKRLMAEMTTIMNLHRHEQSQRSKFVIDPLVHR